MAKSDTSRAIPPYLPYETFTNALAYLKATAVPGRIDKGAFPSDMHSLQRGQVQSALKFLGLIDASEHTKEGLRSLVAAHGTEGWQHALLEQVADKYSDIIGDLDLDTATQRQLDERFATSGVSGQMLNKSVRFYLAMLTDAGVTFSPHLGRRKVTAGQPRKKKVAQSGTQRAAKKRADQTPADTTKDDALPEGMIDVPIPIGSTTSYVRVPLSITTKQMPLVKAAYGVVEALAAQNSEENQE